MGENLPVCIFDVGSYETKFGVAVAGDITKGHEQSSLLPQKIVSHGSSGNEKENDLSKKKKKQNFLSAGVLLPPVERGMIKNFDAFEDLLSVVFKYDFPIEPSDFNFLFGISSWNSPSEFIEMGESLFEGFQVHGAAFKEQESLALLCLVDSNDFASEMRSFTGIIVNCGASVTYISPIAEGYPLLYNSVMIPLAGEDVDVVFFNELLAHPTEQAVLSIEAARVGKEKLAFVAENYEDYKIECMTIKDPVAYEVPSTRQPRRPEGEDTMKNINHLFSACADGPEILFSKESLKSIRKNIKQASHIRRDERVISEAVYDVVQKCAIDCRRKMYENIVVIGGTSTLPGFKKRLQHEIQGLIKSSTAQTLNVNVYGVGNLDLQRYAIWSGGFRFARHEEFSKHILTKQQYEEYGSGVLGRLSIGGKWTYSFKG